VPSSSRSKKDFLGIKKSKKKLAGIPAKKNKV
jgi:hypothetical protein